MKRAMQAGLLALLSSAGPVLAQGGVTVYGILDTYLDAGKTGDRSATRVQSGGISGSRVGFRGNEDLGGGTKAIFLVESGVNVDDGSLGQGGLLFGRQAWVGLSTAAGDLTVGRQYSPNFFLLVTYGLGGGLAWGNASNYFTDLSPLRVNNSVSYASPVVAGFRARALYGFGENTSLPGGTGVGAIHGMSVQYDRGAFSAAVSWEARRTTAQNTDRYYVAGASYRFQPVHVGVLLQARRDDIGAAESNAAEVSVLVPLGLGHVLLDAGTYRNRSAARAGAKAYSVRYDHYLSKRTMVYGGVAKLRNDALARFGINGNTGAALAALQGEDPRSVILGIRHAF